MLALKIETVELPGFPGYTVSPNGKVFKNGKPKVVSCKKGRSAKVIIRINRKMYTLGLATLIAELFIPNPWNYSHIIFKDYDHHNCTKDNIAWVDDDVYFFYCTRGKRKAKIILPREEAARKATDINMHAYYKTLDEEWLSEAWKKIHKEMTEFSFWPDVMSVVYMHFMDRARRFSILGDPAKLMWFYAKAEWLHQRKEISPNMPYKKLVQSDESLRNPKRTYRREE
jgi:hypothetical protein